MAVISVKLLVPGEVEQNEDLTLSAREQYSVLTNNRSDDKLTILVATGVPRVGDLYVGNNGETDTRLLGKTVKVTRSEESPWQWLVEVEYGSVSVDPARQEENPLLRPAEISFDFARYRKLLVRAWNPATGLYDAAAVVNSAQVP